MRMEVIGNVIRSTAEDEAMNAMQEDVQWICVAELLVRLLQRRERVKLRAWGETAGISSGVASV